MIALDPPLDKTRPRRCAGDLRASRRPCWSAMPGMAGEPAKNWRNAGLRRRSGRDGLLEVGAVAVEEAVEALLELTVAVITTWLPALTEPMPSRWALTSVELVTR